jgi:nucleotide-binding universal stress UspA family protein
MRAVVGVDLSGSISAAHLLTRCKFDPAEIRLVHVVESIFPDGSFPPFGPNHAVTEMIYVREEEGKKALDRAKEALGNGAEAEIRRGDPARELMTYADEADADLIAIHSEAKGTYGDLFFGSVAKGLVQAADQSLLVAKGESAADGPLQVVFATDHSEYAARSLDLLLSWAPKGWGKVWVVTANETAPAVAALLVHDLPHLVDEAPIWIREKLEELNRKTVERFVRAGIPAEGVVIDAHPNDAMRTVMMDTGADLLAMGAQGHGFLARLRMGSKSFHQVVSEKYSVLVLRPQIPS